MSHGVSRNLIDRPKDLLDEWVTGLIFDLQLQSQLIDWPK